ncbi:MAG: acyl-ACP--UDP-N-acetylglucosamine O-acyltransferase [Ruminobacter sp.]|jgi:UDP-N-acetylglucosamine acyltransferase|uniref:Acyl-[acyl-carrier-protein]--UDP-N-acetylglucosamine O-acyltransferase n=1 Tax=Ruminobacter amylophilus TaxID=867 RepID=A0A662ZHA3_9GAMM|nr:MULTISPECIES: acyl-ACP--UDP-N-acetylglucosamine O-acyltransferase [Ruminobacter]MBQ3774766.1 acyl-ACP--UDP-N-acetylglucosamine O-acyltransferase [Ruminobacter sp.]SFP20058.1 acyl-[acyl-carrier-protein]--UDP-N-acetylglucosamine O-acyltransferase [Ruminobacter amylophilus]
MIDKSAVIHSTAIVSDDAVIGPGVTVGPWTIIGSEVEIGEGTSIASHCVVKGPVKIGKRNKIFQFATIGEDCQDKKYAGERTFLEIGDDNVIREHCTFHRGTVQDNCLTKVGSRNLFMVNVHVAHDCVVGDDCIFANNATLAGHVHIGNWVIFGGLAAIHQFGRVGDHAFIAGMAALNQDVPPFVMAAGHYAKPFGINKEGLRRRGFSNEAISTIRHAYMIVYKESKTVDEAITKLAPLCEQEPSVQLLVDFLKESTRGICR